MNEIETLIFVLEMVGIAAVAVSGVMVAAARELDVLGALVLGAVTSVGGGVIRDILLGALPPAMFVDPRYVAAAVGVSLVTFIVALGLIAFCFGTAGGVLFGKIMCWATHGKVNPLIGSAGVSAVPMAARVSQKVGQQENPQNFLLMHAMGPNVAGVIGSAVAAGILINMLK